MVKYCIRGHAKTPDNVYEGGACKICARERARKWKEDHPGESEERARKWQKENSERYRENQRKHRLQNIEKETENRRRWRSENKDRKNETARKWYNKNRERLLAEKRIWNDQNKDAVNKSRDKWVAANIGKAKNVKKVYKLSRLDRVPKWLTKEQLTEIDFFYLYSNWLTKNTGIQHHVDHIVPLKGKKVSGLHVPWNLQVIPAVENLKKHNKHECV